MIDDFFENKENYINNRHKVWVDRDELVELIDRGLNSTMKNDKGFVFALERLKVHLGVDEK